ncbi:hypothetical protein SAMN04488012_101484 [Palleronia salina]|uniref:Lipoprotein n=1 Tax=Palleronia salina TaxID=313368 RepID=A0A1M6BGC7_9RHOB|nr:hypothetical protein [Palleronia salina]SHI47759.1 hypothetical protein SAMN04488012_101484 [Palleronia salina]
MRTVVTGVMVIGLLAGCGRVADSRLNPFNWFSRSAPAAVTLSDAPAADPRPLIDQIATLEVTQNPGGAVVRATGVADRQGFYEGALLRVPGTEPGVLAYEFRAAPPPTATRVSTERSREVTVAEYLTNRQLGGIREIRVSGARNARAVRR